jgi:hypothetical protein
MQLFLKENYRKNLALKFIRINNVTYLIEIIQEKNDTISSEEKIYSENNKICEIRYFRTLKQDTKLSKEDLFMRGIKPFSVTDSIRVYAYDEDWKVKEIQLLQDRKSIEKYGTFSYSPKEFQLTETDIYVTGKAKEDRRIHISVQNLTAQDYFVEISEEGKKASISKAVLVESRSFKSLDFDIKFASGFKALYLTVENSNNKTKDLKVQTIGYDLNQSDFVAEEDLRKRRAIELKIDKDVFIEIVGNNKLVTFRNKKIEINLPTSKLLNKLDGGLLPKGKYIAELQNLGTAEKRYCRIRIK